MNELKIKGNEVHLWYQDLGAPHLQNLAENRMDLLNAEETERYYSFKSPGKRREYWVTRVFVRTVLSKYLPFDFSDFKFSENGYGRPELEFPKLIPTIRFNISHCEGLLVCAVGLNCDLGIDIEETKEMSDLTGIAKRHFSVAEFEDLEKCDLEFKTQRFYEYWTLKEAYTKALGTGLSTPLQDFGFALNPCEPIKLTVNSLPDINLSNWSFRLHRPTEKHQMALAVRQSGISDLNLIEYWNLLIEKN